MTTDKGDSPTKQLFDSLRRLYQQAQLLLLDSDRLMGGKGWEPMNSQAPAEFSYSVNTPHKWFARYAARFYLPQPATGEGAAIPSVRCIPFVSTHFASDDDTEVDEPMVSAGYLLFIEKLTPEQARRSFGSGYWICKSGFWGKAILDQEGLRQWEHPAKWIQHSQCTRTFRVPLYNITSSEALKGLVIDRLVSAMPSD
ncbi:MAG: hypothetical protein Q8O40_01825 [Chloroflexota bacterium]|nr:hypothetical protein [Chloroflexota bacterium]